MKPSTSSAKIWALFVGGIFLALFVIFGAVGKLTETRNRDLSTVGVGQGGGFIASDAAMEAGFAPSIAPEPDFYRTGGGAIMKDLEGNVPEQRIIKNGNMTLRVSNVDTSMEQARSIAKVRGGVVESSSVSDPGAGPRTSYMTLRVPVTEFDNTISDLKKLAVVVQHESTNAQDVTMEFIDLEADLRNAKAEEESYLNILERSGSVEEILAVTQQLAATRQRIERLEGRMRYMESQTDLATISLTMTEETRIEAPTSKWEPGEVLRDAIQAVIIGFQAIVDFVIRAFVATVGLLLPIGLLLWLVAWLVMKAVRKWFK